VQGASSGLRPVDYFICGVAIVALIAAAVAMARGGPAPDATARQAAEKAAAAAKDLERQVKELRDQVSEVRDLRKQILALEDRLKEATAGALNEAQMREAVRKAVDDEMKTRQEQFAKDLDRRANDAVARFANDPNLQQLTQALKDAAEKLQQPKAEPPAPPVTVAAEKAAPKPADTAVAKKDNKPANEGIAKSANALAEGMKLWSDLQQGKITREEFDKQSRELAQRARADFEKNLTPEQKAELERRVREWQQGNRGGGGGGTPPAGGGGGKDPGNF
jgi:hypothetical protein